jgi:hypothetical protein
MKSDGKKWMETTWMNEIWCSKITMCINNIII